MNKFKIALVQEKSQYAKKKENIQRAMEIIHHAKSENADLVLFPEGWITGYDCPDILKKLPAKQEIQNHPDVQQWIELAIEDSELKMICDLASQLKIMIVITSLSKGSQWPQNTAYLIDRQGEFKIKYHKVHTCDFDWEQYLESGDEFFTTDVEGICIGLMICYDREYPESARELMLQGAEIILVPNDCDCMKPRLMELQVRAMENMAYIAMANPPGMAAGNSCAFSPMVWDDHGTMTHTAIVIADSAVSTMVMAEFDLQCLREYRNREDLGKYRKVKAYRNLIDKEE